MILTGPYIEREVERGRIVVEPFSRDQIEPNSYGCRLAPALLVPRQREFDSAVAAEFETVTIPDEGKRLEPGILYLGCTVERIGSEHYASTLHARRSTSTAGVWIHVSAPLGHTGAIIPWTLEITVVHPVTVYGGMLIGKIAFWVPGGDPVAYEGKYAASDRPTPSKLALDMKQAR